MKVIKKIFFLCLAISFSLGFNLNYVSGSDVSNFDRVVGEGGEMNNGIAENVIAKDTLSKRSVPDIIGTIIKVILGLSGVVSLVFVIWGGIDWMISQGDPGKIKKARERMVSAAIGILIIAVSYAVTDFIIGQIEFIAG